MDEEQRERIGKELLEALGPSKVLWKDSDIVLYRKDTYRIDFDKDYSYIPDFVVLPESSAEVGAVVMIASRYRIPLIPKGGGSNRTGMLVPVSGGIVVDTIKMNKVLDLSPSDNQVTVQSGITVKNLEDYLNEHGLTLTQVQGSQKIATVGGAIATSAFSRKNQKHGTIADRVLSLEVVLANGEVLRTGPKVLYTSTGYRLHQLFIGSEGTLGIITEATLRVEPYPEARDMVLAFFENFWKAKEAALRVMATCVTFTGGEAYEAEDVSMLGAPEGRNGVLYVGLDGTEGEVSAEREYISRIVEDTGGIIADPEHTLSFMDRYTEQWCGARVSTRFEDALTTYVPMAKIDEFYDRLWNDVMKRHGIEPIPGEKYGIDFGRYRMAAGRFMIPSDEGGWNRYQQALRDVAELAIELGGSISSCHGVGLEHKENIKLEYSATAMGVMRNIKKMLDPDDIMNPGKKIDIG
jgi:glycolate oxidase